MGSLRGFARIAGKMLRLKPDLRNPHHSIENRIERITWD
jgi:hypothetical protein